MALAAEGCQEIGNNPVRAVDQFKIFPITDLGLSIASFFVITLERLEKPSISQIRSFGYVIPFEGLAIPAFFRAPAGRQRAIRILRHIPNNKFRAFFYANLMLAFSSQGFNLGLESIDSADRFWN